jgi:hypothetical protein
MKEQSFKKILPKALADLNSKNLAGTEMLNIFWKKKKKTNCFCHASLHLSQFFSSLDLL